MVQDGNETGKGTRDWIGLDGLVCKRLQFGLCGGLVGVVMDNDKAVLGAEGEFAAVDFCLGAAGQEVAGIVPRVERLQQQAE